MNYHTLFLAVAGAALFTACTSGPAETAAASPADSAASTDQTVAEEEKPQPVTKVKYFKEGEFTPPTGTTYSGNIMASSTWEDSNGYNFILLTQDEDIEIYSEEYQDAVRSRFLHGYHYTYPKAGTTPQLLWSIVDRYEECEFDLIVHFVENSLEITDLNNNGIAESVFMYKADCASDYSPMLMKLLMHEGDTKYALRGTSSVNYSPDGEKNIYGGEYDVDPSFKDASDLFLEFAQEKWKDFNEL